MNIEVSTLIRAPRDRAFALGCDLRRMKEWLPDCPRFEVLTDGPLRVGTRYRETRIVMGGEDTEEYEVVEFVPPELVVVVADGRQGTAGRGLFRFAIRAREEGPSATRVTMTGHVTKLGCLGFLMAPMVRRIMRNTMVKDLEAMKGWIERS